MNRREFIKLAAMAGVVPVVGLGPMQYKDVQGVCGVCAASVPLDSRRVICHLNPETVVKRQKDFCMQWILPSPGEVPGEQPRRTGKKGSTDGKP